MGKSQTILLIVAFSFIILMIATFWRIFQKAGYAGGEAVIPLYNNYVLFSITMTRPTLYFVLSFIPYVGILLDLGALMNLATVFNKPRFYKVGIILLPFIFLPIIAFGKSEYVGILGRNE